MAGPPRPVLLLAERIGVHDDGWSIRPFLDRLEGLGFSVRVVCVEAAGDATTDPRVVGARGLAHRWRQPFAVRNLRLGERIDRPELLHVVQSRMSEAGLAVAEHWELPYVLTVDEFVRPGGCLRVSRRWCRRLVATSRELADDLRNHLGVPAGGVTVIHPGIETPEEEVAPRGEPGRVEVIGTAGPLVASSGFATFLGAARRVVDAGVDAEFVIAGQGEDEVDLRRRADRLKIADRVTFAGIPVVGLRFWSVLDVFCQPSLVSSVGRTLATALAFGVPSVASDIEGLRALVTHEVNGLRVPPGDSAALARAILSLLADPARAEALGRQGRAVIRRDFRPDAEARSLAALYTAVLDTGADTPEPTPGPRALAR
jgi:glycosyltransferase involved in cell wall biosynthesis